MSKQLEHTSDGTTANPSKLVCKKCKQTYTYQTLGSFGCPGYPTDTNQASELFELCKEVYEKTGWIVGDESWEWYTTTDAKLDSMFIAPKYYTDYLLEKLPEEVKKRVLVVTNGDRPHAGYAERDNYGNYTLDEYYWKNAQYSNEVRKALLKLTIALSEAGELDNEQSTQQM